MLAGLFQSQIRLACVYSMTGDQIQMLYIDVSGAQAQHWASLLQMVYIIYVVYDRRLQVLGECMQDAIWCVATFSTSWLHCSSIIYCIWCVYIWYIQKYVYICFIQIPLPFCVYLYEYLFSVNFCCHLFMFRLRLVVVVSLFRFVQLLSTHPVYGNSLISICFLCNLSFFFWFFSCFSFCFRFVSLFAEYNKGFVTRKTNANHTNNYKYMECIELEIFK